MINEVFVLSKSLARCELHPPDWHPWVTGLKRGEGLIVGINASGNVETIEYAPAEKLRMLWKIEPHNQKNFPAINLKGPIWKVNTDSQEVRELVEIKNSNIKARFYLLKKICKNSSLAYIKQKTKKGTDTESRAALKKLEEKIFKFPEKLLPYFQNEDEYFSAFKTP